MKTSVKLASEFASNGMERELADSVAEAIVSRADAEQETAKELRDDFGEMRGEHKAHLYLTKVLVALVLGLYVAIFLSK